MAMRLFVKKNHGFFIALWNAICLPSGDHFGFESGPSCATSGRTEPSETLTTEMSAVPPLAAFGILAVVERDGLAVGRPLEAADRESSVRQPPRLDRLGDRRGHLDHVQVRHPIVGVHDVELTVSLVAVLHRVGLRVRHRHRDGAAVWRPIERTDAVLDVGEQQRFAACRADRGRAAACRCDRN